MIKDSFIVVRKVRTRVRTSGAGEQAIIFIHGNSCIAENWDPQLNDSNLQKATRLIAIDLPGHGGSGKAVQYTLAFMKDFIVGLIDELKLDKYVVCALSYGTALAAEAAPELKNCRGFFLASPNITSNQFPPGSYIKTFPELGVMVAASVSEADLRGFTSHLVLDEHPEQTEQFVKSYQITDPKFRVDLGTEMQNTTWSDEFQNLFSAGVPVRYVFGMEDEAMNIHYMEFIKFPDNHSTEYIEGAGHFVNIDQPGKFNQSLKNFLDAIG
jgi:pyruvate dehydrogenase E2 component (dihydrolipoamide acetyltransferase)